MPRRKSVYIVVLAVFAVAVLAYDVLTAEEEHENLATVSEVRNAVGSSTGPGSADESSTPRAESSTSILADAGLEQAERAPDEASQRAADSMVARILSQVEAEERHGGPHRASPEMVANIVDNYVNGVADTYESLAPADQEAMRRSLQSAMCGETSAASRVVLGQMVERAPALSTAEGLDCILANEIEEGPALAAVLDAWREQGYSPSPNWEQWRQRASSPQIQRRFLWDHRLASGRYQETEEGEIVRND